MLYFQSHPIPLPFPTASPRTRIGNEGRMLPTDVAARDDRGLRDVFAPIPGRTTPADWLRRRLCEPLDEASAHRGGGQAPREPRQ
jgi:hypothetical protein